MQEPLGFVWKARSKDNSFLAVTLVGPLDGLKAHDAVPLVKYHSVYMNVWDCHS